jgi:hypothetical protein
MRYITIDISLTVPNSTKTAVPADATSAPSIHITKVIPTLPDVRKMMLGAANTLITYHQPHFAVDLVITNPVPITLLNISITVLARP